MSPATLCKCGDAGLCDLPRCGELDVFSGVNVVPPSVTFLCGGRGVGPFLRSGGEEGIDGDKVDGFVEESVGKCAYGELGRDDGG